METPHPQKRTDQPRGLRGTLAFLVVVGLVVLTISSFLVLRTPEKSQAVNNAPTPYVTLTPEPRGVAPSPAQPSAQAIESARPPYPFPTSVLAGSAPRGATMIPYGPPTSYVTLTRGPDGRIAPGGIPVTPTAGPSPRPTATPFPITGKQPPACTFPLAQTTTADSAPETYTFSDVKSAPYNPSWRLISLFQWLPDNQRVLIAHTDEAQMSDLQETIGLYNPRTGESQDFGSRSQPGYARPPAWIPSLKGVVYPESLLLTSATFSNNDQSSGLPPSHDYQRRLWFSQGGSTHPQALVDERVTVTYDRPSQVGEEFTVVASPDGSEIVYLDDVGKQLYVQRVLQGALQSVPSPSFDATQWTYRPPMDLFWHMTWRPNSTQVFLYSYVSHPAAPTYTFLLDTQSGQVCELTLWEDDPKIWFKSHAVDAHWSPNGRYLAVERERGSIPIDLSELIVLDTATGQRYRMDATQFSPAGLPKEGIHSVGDLAWAPDNRHLAAIGGVSYCTVGCIDYETPSAARLFLVDFLTGQPVQISSAELRTIGQWPSEGLLWSSDGSQLIVPVVYGPYLLSVQKQGQP